MNSRKKCHMIMIMRKENRIPFFMINDALVNQNNLIEQFKII